jgi:hypothetical protein
MVELAFAESRSETVMSSSTPSLGLGSVAESFHLVLSLPRRVDVFANSSVPRPGMTQCWASPSYNSSKRL